MNNYKEAKSKHEENNAQDFIFSEPDPRKQSITDILYKIANTRYRTVLNI